MYDDFMKGTYSVKGKEVIMAKQPYRHHCSKLFCDACTEEVRWNNRKLHVFGESHQQKKSAMPSANVRNVSLLQLANDAHEEGRQGSSLDPKTKSWRIEVLDMCCVTNMSFTSAIRLQPFAEKWSEKKMGGERALRDYIPTLLRQYKKEIQEALTDSDGKYALIVDGSPFGFEALGVKIRFLRKKRTDTGTIDQA